MLLVQASGGHMHEENHMLENGPGLLCLLASPHFYQQ